MQLDFSNGIIIVFGHIYDTSGEPKTITSPITFTSIPNCFMQTSWQGDQIILVLNVTLTSFDCRGNVGKGAYLMIGI